MIFLDLRSERLNYRISLQQLPMSDFRACDLATHVHSENGCPLSGTSLKTPAPSPEADEHLCVSQKITRPASSIKFRNSEFIYRATRCHHQHSTGTLLLRRHLIDGHTDIERSGMKSTWLAIMWMCPEDPCHLQARTKFSRATLTSSQREANATRNSGARLGWTAVERPHLWLKNSR